MGALPSTGIFGHHGDSSGPIKGLSDPNFASITVTTRGFWFLSIGIYIGLFLSMMDASIVASSLPTIAADFNVLTSVNWVALAYTLAECSCCVVFTRVSDIIGRRNTFVAAEGLFFSFSLACGFSKNLSQLVAFRALQGIGGAGLYSLTMVILPEVCPFHLQEYGAGITGVVIVISFIVGPILGGAFTHYASWRWIFWINGPMCVISTILFIIFWPKADDLLPITLQPWRSFDFIGSVFLIAATVLVVFAFQNVSTVATWGSSAFIAPVVIGLTCWMALFTWEYLVEYRTTKRAIPAFPLSLFRNRFYTSGVASTLFLGFPLLLLIFSVPLRAQLVSGKDSLVAALMLLPMLGLSAIGSVIAAGINSKKNYLSETLLVGACFSTLGCSLLTTISDSGDDKKLMCYLAFVGLGCGLSIASATTLTAVEIPPRDYAPAQGIMAQARILGGSFGIATSSVFLHSEVTKLVGRPFTAPLAMLGDSVGTLPSQARILVQQACSQAFQGGMVVSAAIAGATVLLTLIGYQRAHNDIKQQRLDLVRGGAPTNPTSKTANEGECK